MLKKVFKISGILAVIIFIIGTLAFTSVETKNVRCNTIDIEFDEDDQIRIKKEELIRIVKKADTALVKRRLQEINTELIELAVEKHQAVLNAEVFTVLAKDTTSLIGVVRVRVQHRKPLVRIHAENGSYYLDEYGGKIPVSPNYTANVLVVTGDFTEKYARDELLPFILWIENDEFWKAQIEQVHVDKGDITLTPLVGEHLIEFGDLSDFKRKLIKMEAFYKQVLAKDNWNKYKTVSLKYNDQVIAKKR